ncbi:MAG: hypothetical protein JNL74_23045, partial [Fibrobacteres bacterium]|nr:hypothetical protein [Fibrobacterota bacterium]
MKQLIILVSLCSVIFSAPIVELTVKERMGQARTGEPVTTGVPLPNGLLTDVNNLALTDAAGNKVNCEFRKVSEWHNNTSVKWVHLDFQTSLAESGSVKYVLHDDASKHAITGSTLTVTDQGSRFEVNTGKIKFFVKKANYNVIDEALIGTDTIITPHSRGLALKIGSNEYLSSSDASSTTTIERQGGMAVCIKSEGYLKMGASSSGLFFQSRIYAYNNSPVIKYVLAFELHKSMVKDSIVVKSLFIDLPTKLSNATATLGAPTAPQSAALAAGDTSYVVASNPFTIAMGANDAKVFYKFGGKATGNGDAMVSSTHFHDKALGWGSLSNGSKGFAFSFRDYWQQNPKSLELYGSGLCRIGLYPELRNGEFLDLKWYSGMARTVEMRLALIKNENSNDVKALVHGIQTPLLAIAPPSWYCSDTRAFGLLVERDTSKIKQPYQ